VVLVGSAQNLPAVHVEQVDEPAGEYFPTPHGVLTPLAQEKPAGQFWQLD